MKLFGIMMFLIIHLASQSNGQHVPRDFARHGFQYIESKIDNTISIDLPNGVTRKKLLEYSANNALSIGSIDSTILDVRTLDTSIFASKYTLWRELPVGATMNWEPVIGDVNNNGLPEVYGHEKFYSTTDPPPAVIYELDSLGHFTKIFHYADTIYTPQAIVDLTNDGDQEIIMNGETRSMVFRQDSASRLPVHYATKFGRFHSTAHRPQVVDFDNNGKKDVVYTSDLYVIIEEYDSSSNTFDSVYSHYSASNGVGGFSIGDFDADGKTDIVFGTIQGDVRIIEAQGEHQYQVVWSSTVETYNAYLHFWTNDLDGNGKPEFWVGGDAFYSGVGKSRFTCFESNGNNSYEPVAKIDLIGIFSFFAGNCLTKDIDKDGKQELFICLDQHVFIITFSGIKNEHRYSLLYAKRNDMANQNSVYYSAGLYDFTNDGIDELMIQMDQVQESLGRRDFSRIYSLDFLTTVQQREIPTTPATTELFQNYPNPFNPSTTIRFRLANDHVGKVIVKVYNILGKEIRELLNEQSNSGEYVLRWDGRDNLGATIESGVFFISLQTSSYRKTIKTILLK